MPCIECDGFGGAHYADCRLLGKKKDSEPAEEVIIELTSEQRRWKAFWESKEGYF